MVVRISLLVVSVLGASPETERARAIARMNEGIQSFRDGDVEGAEVALVDATLTDPTYARAHLVRGQIERRTGKLAAARVTLERGLSLPDAEVEVVARLAYELGRTHAALAEQSSAKGAKLEQQAAVAAFDRAIDVHGDHYRAHYRRAIQLERLDRPEAADASYRACIDIEPRYAPCFVALGFMYVDYGFADLGMAVLEAGVSINSGDAHMWSGLARALLALGRAREAVAALEKAQRIAPEHGDVLFGLGMAHAELRNTDEATHYLQRFIDEVGNDVPEFQRRAALDTLARMRDVF
jgi:tetratricopeptide (TPR) repeat protein